MGLATPEKIRTLQRKLYVKAKGEPEFRFYLLSDKVWRADILEHAYRLCRSNGGAAGVDGVTFAGIEAAEGGLESWLRILAAELREERYRPQAVRRVMIPKPDGGERPLGIPTVRDRVVQQAAKLVVEPIFEADFEPNAYGYRPRRGALDAVKKRVKRFKQSLRDVLHAGNHAPLEEVVGEVNRKLRGWGQYFSIGTLEPTYRRLDRYTTDLLRKFLVRRHKVPGRGTRPFSYRYLYEDLGLVRLQDRRRVSRSHASA